MKLLPFILAVGTTVSAQNAKINQPFLSNGSDAYCFVGGITWPDGKQYDAVVKLEQLSPDGLQVNIGKRYQHDGLRGSPAKTLWAYSAGLDPMYLHVNGSQYGDNVGDTATSNGTYRFGGKNSTPLTEADKNNVAKILGMPECKGK